MKKRRRTPGLVKAGVLCLSVFFAVSLIHLQMQIGERQGRLAELNDQIKEQTSTNAALRDQVENGVSDDYIADMARDIGYVLPNERVFVNSSSK